MAIRYQTLDLRLVQIFASLILPGQSECLQCPQSESFVQSNSFQRLALTSVFECNRVHRSNWNLQVINLQKYLLNFDCCRKVFESLLPTSNTRNLSPPPHSYITVSVRSTENHQKVLRLNTLKMNNVISFKVYFTILKNA